jgi:hypothetical protein
LLAFLGKPAEDKGTGLVFGGVVLDPLSKCLRLDQDFAHVFEREVREMM